MDNKEKSIKLHLDKAIGYSDKAHDELQIALNIALDGKGLSNEEKRLLSVDFATGQEEAVELINAHNDNVDAQDVDIFISGFSLVYSELLNPILPILERCLSSSAISWQGRMRIALAIQQCKKLKKNNYGKRI